MHANSPGNRAVCFCGSDSGVLRDSSRPGYRKQPLEVERVTFGLFNVNAQVV